MNCPGEEQLAEYACGSLHAGERTVVETHVDACTTCRRSISALATALASVGGSESPPPADADSIRAGTTIGRYVVLYPIGHGFMGDVYAAYDPELDRKIALKLLRERATTLAAEARALAKLAHPNVVAVHDVGLVGERVFLAMEYVAGQTLRSWLQSPRTWREICDVLASAGRGLAAAHDAGLVHRDFKPDNVLIGRDGRVQVCDFGLARGEGSDGAPIAGTPAYMAPEQFHGARPEPASDQFSFAVSAFEAICGVRPFESTPALAAQPRAFEPQLDVPRHVREVVTRALEVDPDRRFSSMHELLEQFTDQRRPRRHVLAVVAALAAGAIVIVASMRHSAAPPPCAEAAAGARSTVPARELMRARFIASGKPAGITVFARFAARVDDYAAQWRSARIGTCEATRVRGAQSEAMLDAKMTCLDRRRDELAALVDIYSAPIDEPLLERAISAAAALPRIDDCTDSKAMLQAVPPPAGEAQRARLAAARTALGRARVLRLAAHFDEGLALAQAQLEVGRALEFAPLVAEASYELGYLQEEKRADAASEQTMRAAIQAGAAAHDDVLVAKAWIRLLRIGGVNLQHHVQVDEWLTAARAAVARAGNRDDLLGSLEDTYAGVLMQKAEFAAAREHYQRAYDLEQRVLRADDPQLASTAHNLGSVLVEVGELEQGRAALARSLASWEKSLGPDHPNVALALADLGRVSAQSGDLDQAERYLERSLHISEAAYGRDHLEVWLALDNLANVTLMRGDFMRARAMLQRSLAIVEAQLGPDHLDVAATLSALGTVEVEDRKFAAARGYLVRVIEIRERVSKQSPDLIAPLVNLGTAVAELGDKDAGRQHIERALAIAESQLGKAHPAVVGPCSRLGDLAAERGDRTQAAAYYVRALAILRKLYGNDHPDVLAIQRDLDRVEGHT